MLHIHTSKKIMPLILILILVLMAAGCSSEKKIKSEEAEITVKNDNESVEISSDDEKIKAEIKLEGSAEIPEGYPDDSFPIYPKSTVVMAQTMKDDGVSSYSVSIKNNDEINKVYEFYKDAVKSGDNLMDLKTQNTYSLAGSMDGCDFGIIIAPNDLGGDEKTMIQISLCKQK